MVSGAAGAVVAIFEIGSPVKISVYLNNGAA